MLNVQEAQENSCETRLKIT